MRRVVLALCLGSALALAGGTSALAEGGDPPGFGPVHVHCPETGDFDIIDQGNGPFGAGHVIGNNSQHIVTGFSEFHLEVWVDTNGDGDADTMVFVEDRPPSVKGGGNAGPKDGRIESCPFDYDVVFPDGTRVTGYGVVEGFLTPANK